jgi:hypothetical protein
MSSKDLRHLLADALHKGIQSHAGRTGRICISAGSNGPETWRVRPALGHPVLSRNFDGIEKVDFPPFLRDCAYIREELSSLIELVRELQATLPENFGDQ